MPSVRLPQHIVDAMINAARANREDEICGLLSSSNGHACRLYPIDNIAEDRQHRFQMDPAQQIAAIKTMRDRDESLFAIYHSHPQSPAQPSAIDIAQASYPETLYLIISLLTEAAPDIRGFYLREGRIEEVELSR